MNEWNNLQALAIIENKETLELLGFTQQLHVLYSTSAETIYPDSHNNRVPIINRPLAPIQRKIHPRGSPARQHILTPWHSEPQAAEPPPVRPHGKIRLDTARKPSFVVMAREYDWINIRQSLKPAHSVPGGDVTRGRQWGFYSVRGGLNLQGTYRSWKHRWFCRTRSLTADGKGRWSMWSRPGSSDILSHCLLKTGLIIQPTLPAWAISVREEQVTCITAN